MKYNWFKKFGLIYYPISITGAIFTVLIVAFCITVFCAIDKHSHSVSDTLYGIFPYFISAFTLLFWVAANSCKGS
jgi:hypothetical protein